MLFKTHSTTLFILFVTLIFTGCKNNPASEEELGDHIEVNEWIQSHMQAYYFWNEMVPEEADGFQQPEVFFESMLEADDEFSYMSDDAETLQAELEGTSYTAGYSPAFGRFSGSNNVFIIVEYVYPESPADEAGLERGDIILKINGTSLTIDNYVDLYYDDSDATLTLGDLDQDAGVISEGGTIDVSKAELELDPVVFTNVYEKDDATVGYFFYAGFRNGEGDQFIETVDNAMSNFEAQGVTELIIDLRYNRGGRLSAASNLANSLAPSSAVNGQEIFVSYQYNEELQKVYEDQEGPDSPNLVSRFSEHPVQLNLDRIFFLTTSSSASASELLINGLDPYIDVVSIGTNTYGKFYGSYVITGEDANPPHNYAILPVVLKYANSLGVTDFRDGLTPTHTVDDDLFNAKAIGDTTDALLAKAFELITGETPPPAKAPTKVLYEKLDNPIELKKGNVMFEVRKD